MTPDLSELISHESETPEAKKAKALFEAYHDRIDGLVLFHRFASVVILQLSEGKEVDRNYLLLALAAEDDLHMAELQRTLKLSEGKT